MISNFCKIAVIFFFFQIIQAWKLWVCTNSIHNCQKFSYENAAQICTSGYFDAARKTYGFVHAYRSSLEADAPKDLINTLLALGDRNVLAVDWSSEANSIFFGLDYIVFAKKVADELTMALSYMSCLRPENTHLIGMSLGAHMVGNAARDYWKLTGRPFAEVIGLDPGKVLYDPPFAVLLGIDYTCATFVVIIHSDTYKYAVSDTRGHVDFWPNADEYIENRHQPGCPVTSPPPFYAFTEDDLCNHRLPLLWYTDSLKYPCELVGTKADSMQAWVDSRGAPNDLTCIGDFINKQSTGNYYMRTNPQSPYGLGLSGIAPLYTQRHNKSYEINIL